MPTDNSPNREQIIHNLRRANAIAQQAAIEGRHPFGATLVAADHETILMQQGNIDSVNHAESTLARRAAAELSPEQLWQTTLYTTVEPCAMCAGTQYWANIGRLVYAMSEKQLLAYTGNHPENPTMELPSREVFARGQKPIDIIGPVDEMIAEVAAAHVSFWQQRH